MKIVLPFKAISVNKQFCADRKFGMLKLAKDFCFQVNWQLQKYQTEFAEMRLAFDETKHGLEISMMHCYKDFYTKKGTIATGVLDITNTEKLLMDLIVDKAHFGPAPYLSPNLKLNDRHVVKLTSSKHPADKDYIVIEIDIVALQVQNS